MARKPSSEPKGRRRVHLLNPIPPLRRILRERHLLRGRYSYPVFVERLNNFHIFFGTNKTILDRRAFFLENYKLDFVRLGEEHPKIFDGLSELVETTDRGSAEWNEAVLPRLYEAYKILRRQKGMTNKILGLEYWD